MFEIIFFIIVLVVIFKFQRDIELLRHEIFLLKRDKQLMHEETPLTQKAPAEPEMKTTTPMPETSLLREIHTPIPKEEMLKVKPHLQPKDVSKKSTPDFFEKLTSFVKNYFTSGNVIVRIGGVILFFGLAFLAKYAAQHSMISMQMRLFTIAFVAVVLVGLGWRLREREGYYGLILQGVGVAIFYLVIYASAKIYLLLPLSLAFVLMLSVVVIGVLLSVKQSALPLALFSIVGGFMTPILTSDGSGSHVALFSYYALLNLGIFLIAWYRSWRILNLTGFLFTFIIATLWGVLRYETQFLLTSEFFLILFYCMYLSVSILFTYKQKFSLSAPIDATLVFGLPIVAFGLQISLVEDIEYALALSAFLLGSLYFALYYLLRSKEKMQLLALSFFALGVLFYTIMLPYIFDTRITATLWALEGTSVIFIALRQDQRVARYFGEILVTLATLVYLFASNPFATQDVLAYVNTSYLGYVFLVVANLFSAYSLDKHSSKLEKFENIIASYFFFMAMLIWFFSGLNDAHMIDEEVGNTMLLYISVWGGVFAALARYFAWEKLTTLLEGYFGLGALFLVGLGEHYLMMHPFEGLGSVALLGFFTMHYTLLYLMDAKWKHQPLLHLLAFWSIVVLLGREVYYQISLFTSFESYYVVGFMGVVVLFLLGLYKQPRLPNFLNKYKNFYMDAGQSGLMLMLFITLVYSFRLDAATGFGYLLLLNPLEIASLGVLLLLYRWISIQTTENKKVLLGLFAATSLLFASVVLARAIHAFVGVEYRLLTLLHSMEFQMGISILWSLIALGTILSAKKMQSRTLWSVGAFLIGIVVIKLFLVELSKSESIERIVSFIVVGILLLLIGYFAPLPPKSEQKV